MSVPKREEKYRQEIITKKIDLWATKEDLAALKIAVDEAGRMFSPELIIKETEAKNRRDKIIPKAKIPRITISDSVDPEGIMYPRTASLLRKLGNAIEEAGRDIKYTTVWASQMSLLQEAGTRPNSVIGLMDTILYGKQTNKGNLRTQQLNQISTDYKNVVERINSMIENPQMRNELLNSNLEWAYVQNLDTHIGASMTDAQKRSFDAMLIADKMKKDYPADFANFSQAYVAILRTSKGISMDIPARIDKDKWEVFLIDYNIGVDDLNFKYKKPPKTMGDVLEFLFAYNVQRMSNMKNALVVSISPNRELLERESVRGTGEVVDGVQEVKGWRSIYKGIVVGSGPVRFPPTALQGSSGSISGFTLSDIPGAM